MSQKYICVYASADDHHILFQISKVTLLCNLETQKMSLSITTKQFLLIACLSVIVGITATRLPNDTQ